jgi:hypothetical protein
MSAGVSWRRPAPAPEVCFDGVDDESFQGLALPYRLQFQCFPDILWQIDRGPLYRLAAASLTACPAGKHAIMLSLWLAPRNP